MRLRPSSKIIESAWVISAKAVIDFFTKNILRLSKKFKNLTGMLRPKGKDYFKKRQVKNDRDGFTRVAFLFIDDTFDECLDLAALTGVLISSEDYLYVRNKMSNLIFHYSNSDEKIINPPIEFHGSKLMPNLDNSEQSDQIRLDICKNIALLANESVLAIFRVGYNNRTEISHGMKIDNKLYDLNFSNLLCMIAPFSQDYVIFPVMDTVPSAHTRRTKNLEHKKLLQAFAGMIRFTHHVRNGVGDEAISIPNIENIAEPVYADSASNTFIQLADVISYLLLQKQRMETHGGVRTSNFKRSVYDIANLLDKRIFCDEVVKMKRHEP